MLKKIFNAGKSLGENKIPNALQKLNLSQDFHGITKRAIDTINIMFGITAVVSGIAAPVVAAAAITSGTVAVVPGILIGTLASTALGAAALFGSGLTVASIKNHYFETRQEIKEAVEFFKTARADKKARALSNGTLTPVFQQNAENAVAVPSASIEKAAQPQQPTP